MKHTVRLFIQKHENRTYTVTLPEFPSISAYGPTLEECKQEITEALVQFLAEMEPASIQQYAFHPKQSLERITVELRPTDRHGKRRRNSFKLTVSLLLTYHDDDQILVTAPRLRSSLSFFIVKKEDLAEIAPLELLQYFHGDSFETLLRYQAARQESLDTLEVDFKPKKARDKQDEEEEDSFWALKQSGTNLTAQASEGQLRRAFRRDSEVDDVLAAIASERRPSILLIGASGAGKSAVAHEVARRIRRRECSDALRDRQVWAVNGDSLIAGCSFVGQWQEKMRDVVQEVRKKRHILFVDDLASLAEAGRHSKGDDNIADFLKPHLQSGDVVIIGEATPERLRLAEQLAPGFVAQFRTRTVEPTNETDTLSILTATSRELERSEDVRIEPAALEAAVELTNRFLPYRVQPGKALALIEQMTSDAARHRGSVTGARPTLARRETIATFTRQTGLPEFIVSDTIPLDLDAVRAYFADRVIGQPAAVDAMVDLIAVVKAGLSDPEKPLGTFLFIGPTGVGKTQLAKTLAKYLFGDEQRVLRFDMSEYSDPAAVRRLIGVPGAGKEAGGELTTRVRAQPFCVVLLDEFEKADPQIYDVFLQVLGEGRLTDAGGATTSFQNAIILLTSNLGASAREQRTMGLTAASEGQGEQADRFRTKVEQYFRPEFVNRLDQIVTFRALDEAAMRQIASRELGDVLLREGLVRRNVLVEIDPNVVDLLLEAGFNATYGARPLKRTIERLIVLPLARFLASRAKAGADLIRVYRDEHGIALGASSFSAAEHSSEVLLSGGSGLKRRRLDDKNLVEAFAELRRKLQDWYEREAVVEMRNERAVKLARTNQPTFWDDGEAARTTLARFYFLDRLLKRLKQLTDRAEHLEEMAGLVHRQRNARYRAELAESYEVLYRDFAFLEVELLCAHLTDNHRAVLQVRRVGAASKDENPTWLTELLAMYLRWTARKGYEAEVFALTPLTDSERQTQPALAPYPFRWQPIVGASTDALCKALASADDSAEIVVLLSGANVFGFLKGEGGVHRRSDKRPSGERVQRLVEVIVRPLPDEPADWLDAELARRVDEEQRRLALSRRERATQTAPAEPPIVRVYQFEGERLVRDLRTQLKVTNVTDVLDGDLDDFILAYLRDEEAKSAWQEG